MCIERTCDPDNMIMNYSEIALNVEGPLWKKRMTVQLGWSSNETSMEFTILAVILGHGLNPVLNKIGDTYGLIIGFSWKQ